MSLALAQVMEHRSGRVLIEARRQRCAAQCFRERFWALKLARAEQSGLLEKLQTIVLWVEA